MGNPKNPGNNKLKVFMKINLWGIVAEKLASQISYVYNRIQDIHLESMRNHQPRSGYSTKHGNIHLGFSASEHRRGSSMTGDGFSTLKMLLGGGFVVGFTMVYEWRFKHTQFVYV